MKIVNVQYLRFVAATLVVCGHALGAIAGFYGPHRPFDFPSGAGVDLFFAISGFIMVHTSVKHFGSSASIRTFLVRRVAPHRSFVLGRESPGDPPGADRASSRIFRDGLSGIAVLYPI